MAVKPRLSINGLYQYDNTIFDLLALPEDVNKNAVVSEVLLESAPLDCLYPDAGFFKSALGMWSESRLPVWGKLYRTTVFEYNPIENYDRIEDVTDHRAVTSSQTSNATGSEHLTNAGESTTTVSTDSNTAFNSDSFKDASKTSTTETPIVNRTTATTSGGNVSGNESQDGTTHSRIHGNIGVTTSQQMIQQERDIAMFDVVHFIAMDIIDKFTVGVY